MEVIPLDVIVDDGGKCPYGQCNPKDVPLIIQ
jgi:hypothetical protein